MLWWLGERMSFYSSKFKTSAKTKFAVFGTHFLALCTLQGKLTLRQILLSTIASREVLSKKIVDTTTPTHITEILFWDTTQIRKVSSDFESGFDNWIGNSSKGPKFFIHFSLRMIVQNLPHLEAIIFTAHNAVGR